MKSKGGDIYLGILNLEELIDSARDTSKFIDMEHIQDPHRVKMECMKLKRHACLWWDTVHLEMQRKGNDKLRTWDIMVVKIKCKFIPIQYTLYLYMNIHNLRVEMNDI